MLYGNLMLIYAVEDIKEGMELTVSNADIDVQFYAQRKENITKKWGSECNCRLCELDRADPGGEEKRKALLDDFKRELQARQVYSFVK